MSIEEILNAIENSGPLYRPLIVMSPEAATELVETIERGEAINRQVIGANFVGFIPVFCTRQSAQSVGDAYSDNSPDVEEFSAFSEE